MSYETRYAATKRQQFNNRADTPEAATDRVARIKAFALVGEMVDEKFPVVTEANFEAALQYQHELVDLLVLKRETPATANR